MGLDCIWTKDDERLGQEQECLDLEFDPPLKLCGGVLSGNGSGSFRGKVYAEFIERNTGANLYHNQENDDVKRIAAALEGREWEPGMDSEWAVERSETWKVSQQEFDDLRRMFRAYADAGARLLAWY